MKLTLKVGAAMAAALAMSFSLAACGEPPAAESAAAAGQVAMAPDGQTMSPGAVTRSLQGRGFTPTNVRRRGGTYVVDARGPSGNDVRMVVDGRAGQIRGMDVRRWAPGQRRISRGSRGNRFVNDTYEFGVTLEDALLADWVLYEEADWVSDEAWIEYEEVEEWEWSEITYEESIEEYSYEEWEAEYGEIETYEESFYEEASWEESYGDEELAYEDEAAYEEELTEDYGEEYYAEYEESEEYWDDGAEAAADEGADAGYEEEVVEEESYEEEAPYEEESSYEEEASYDDGGDAGYDDGGDAGYDGGGGEEY